MLMLVQSLVEGSPLHDVGWKHECILHSTAISIRWFIQLVFFALISIEELDTLIRQTASR